MDTAPKQDVRVHIRWLISKDMEEVLAIENECFEYPWTKYDFIRSLRQRNCIGMAAEYDNRVAGFMIYELMKTRIHVLDFAVLPSYHRMGVGSQMLLKLVSKLSAKRKNRIILETRETNLSAQLFFRANGFKAVSVLRNFYTDTPEDAYLMQYNYRQEQSIPGFQGSSRITKLAG